MAIDVDDEAPSQSSHPYRRMTSDEEASLVKIAVRYARIREDSSIRNFCIQVASTFHSEHGWQYKSVGRKLLDLERDWRVIFKNRGSGTGSEHENNELSQAMERWIEVVDGEKKKKAERLAATKQAKDEAAVATTFRDNLVQRMRNKPRVDTVELLSDEDYVDQSEDEDTVAAAAAHPAMPVGAPSLGGSSTPMVVTDSDTPSSPYTPTTARGNGHRRPRVRTPQSARSRDNNNTMALLIQLEERRERREAAARKEQADREERREERELAARERELAMREQMMQQMNTLLHAVVHRREQPVHLLGDYPSQSQGQIDPQLHAPQALAYGGPHGGNYPYPTDATTRPPSNQFG